MRSNKLIKMRIKCNVTGISDLFTSAVKLIPHTASRAIKLAILKVPFLNFDSLFEELNLSPDWFVNFDCLFSNFNRHTL